MFASPFKRPGNLPALRLRWHSAPVSDPESLTPAKLTKKTTIIKMFGETPLEEPPESLAVGRAYLYHVGPDEDPTTNPVAAVCDGKFQSAWTLKHRGPDSVWLFNGTHANLENGLRVAFCKVNDNPVLIFCPYTIGKKKQQPRAVAAGSGDPFGRAKELDDAIKSGKPETVEGLLQNFPDSFDPWHKLIDKDHKPITIHRVIVSPAQAPSKKRILETLVNWVVMHQDADKTVDKFLNFPDDEGKTPMHYAVVRGDLDSLRMLREMGANPNFATKIGLPIRQLFCYSCTKSPWNDTRQLIFNELFHPSRSIFTDAQLQELLVLAAQNGYPEPLPAIIQRCIFQLKGSDVREQALHKACAGKRPEHGLCVQQLLAHEANPNAYDAEGRTAMHIAAINSSPTLSTAIQIILAHPRTDHCLRVNTGEERGATVLHLSMHTPELVDNLLTLNPPLRVTDVDDKGRTALHYAAACCVLSSPCFSRAFRAVVNQADLSGRTPLVYAVSTWCQQEPEKSDAALATVSALIDNGADLLSEGPDKRTAAQLLSGLLTPKAIAIRGLLLEKEAEMERTRAQRLEQENKMLREELERAKRPGDQLSQSSSYEPSPKRPKPTPSSNSSDAPSSARKSPAGRSPKEIGGVLLNTIQQLQELRDQLDRSDGDL